MRFGFRVYMEVLLPVVAVLLGLGFRVWGLGFSLGLQVYGFGSLTPEPAKLKNKKAEPKAPKASPT